MKQNIVVLALLGLLSFETVNATKAKMDLEKMTAGADQVLTQFEDIDSSLPINQLVIVNNQKKHRFSPQMAQAHEDDSSSDSDSGDSESDDDQQHLQLRMMKKHKKSPVSLVQHRRVEETSPDFEGFPASLDGFVGNNHQDGQWKDAYERVVPGHLDNTDGVPVDKFTANVITNYATEGVTKEGMPNGQFFITRDQTMAIAREVVGTHLGKKGKEVDEFLKKQFGVTWDHYDVNNEGILDANWASPFMRTLCKPEKVIDLQ